jgi:hypothetical protein|tara:strand:+ start:9629 stop:9991 length:363 start_codon:yes stop_codon:yes gene_type:complete
MQERRPTQRLLDLEESIKLALAHTLDEKAWFHGSSEMHPDKEAAPHTEKHLDVAQDLSVIVDLLKDARSKLNPSLTLGPEIDPPMSKAPWVKLAATVAVLVVGVTGFLAANPAATKALPW